MGVVNLSFAAAARDSFISAVGRESGADVLACYQCGKCSAGCPICFAMDHQPHQVVRMVQLGLKDGVLASSSIWLCACCMTCSSRCPRDVDLASVMEALRIMAQREGYPVPQKAVALFHSLFLNSVRGLGRIHEAGLLGRYKLAGGGLTADLGLGLSMLSRGRLKLLPRRIEGAAAVAEIFRRVRDEVRDR